MRAVAAHEVLNASLIFIAFYAYKKAEDERRTKGRKDIHTSNLAIHANSNEP